MSKLILLLALFYCALSTQVTFYIDHEVDQTFDYVEIETLIKAEHHSLDKAVEMTTSIINSVEQLVQKYCHTYSKDNK